MVLLGQPARLAQRARLVRPGVRLERRVPRGLRVRLERRVRPAVPPDRPGRQGPQGRQAALLVLRARLVRRGLLAQLDLLVRQVVRVQSALRGQPVRRVSEKTEPLGRRGRQV